VSPPNSEEAQAGHRPSRIAFLMADLGGGTGDHLLSMIRLWDPRAWDSRILSAAPLTSRHTPDIPVTDVGMKGRLARFPLAQIVTQYRVARALRQHPPDLVHSYFFWSIMYGRFLKRIGRIGRLIENREDEGFAWGDREYAMLRRTRHLPDRVICVSEAVRKVALEREELDPHRTVVVHNGVELETQASESREEVRRELGYEADVPLVGMVSNLNRPIKGIRYFLDAVPLILRAVPSARFVIFGGGFGRGGHEAMLRDRAAALGIAQCVQFAGFRPDIERYYCALDLSVLTSLSEGLSIAVLESMKHGVPVVVTSVGGNPEVVVTSCRLATPEPSRTARVPSCSITSCGFRWAQPRAAGLRRALASRSPQTNTWTCTGRSWEVRRCE
jgi:glycosyltransferase involved in cell wall biosynthesis